VHLCVFRNVDKNDEGVYGCRASNEGGYNDGLMWLLIQSEFVIKYCSRYLRVFLWDNEVRLHAVFTRSEYGGL